MNPNKLKQRQEDQNEKYKTETIDIDFPIKRQRTLKRTAKNMKSLKNMMLFNFRWPSQQNVLKRFNLRKCGISLEESVKFTENSQDCIYSLRDQRAWGALAGRPNLCAYLFPPILFLVRYIGRIRWRSVDKLSTEVLPSSAPLGAPGSLDRIRLPRISTWWTLGNSGAPYLKASRHLTPKMSWRQP